MTLKKIRATENGASKKRDEKCGVKDCQGVRMRTTLKSQDEWCPFSVCKAHETSDVLESHKKDYSRPNKNVLKLKITQNTKYL
jgi:hypothetical protein